MKEFNLFSAADGILAHYISQEDFDNSLIFNVLFQEKLLLHEAYFFSSQFIGDHISKSPHPITLFEAAASAGLIVPAYRSKSVTTLEESYNNMIKIYEEGYKFHNMEHNLPAVYRLYEALNKGSMAFDPFYWPEDINLGIQYHEILKEYLGTDELPEYIDREGKRYKNLDKFWKKTSKWRTEFIDQAAENTVKNGSTGLRRQELFMLIGKDIGLPDSNTNASMDLTEIKRYVSDTDTFKTTKVFLKWMSQCHHIGLARAFNSGLNFPMYQINEDFLAESIARTKEDSIINRAKTFTVEVELPPIDLLLQDKPENLISIRNELGGAYLRALINWQKSPDDNNKNVTEQLFVDYCKRICKWYKKYPPVKVKSTYHAGDVGSKGMDVTQSILTQFIPFSNVFFSVGSLGHSVYQYFSDRKRCKTKKQVLELSVEN